MELEVEKWIALMKRIANIYTVICIVVVVIGIASLVAIGMGLRPFVMISESMHPEVPRNALVLLDTRSNVTDVAVGDNVAYLLGKVEAMHKVVSTDAGENQELVVKPVAETDGKTVVTADTYLGKEVLHIPGVGCWIRSVLNYKWAVIIAAIGLVVGCIPRKILDEKKIVESAEGN